MVLTSKELACWSVGTGTGEGDGAVTARLHQLLKEIRRLEVNSLHAELNADEQENDLEQNVAGPPHQDPLTLCMAGENRERLTKAIAQLPERVQQHLML